MTPERKAEIEAEELARMQIREQLASKKASEQWGKRLLGVLSLIALAVACPPVLSVLDRATSGIEATSRPDTGSQDADQLAMVLKIAGPPDSSTSTEHESPPPPIPSRMLFYDRAGVKVAFLRNANGHSWRLLGFMDYTTGQAMSDVTALARLRRAKK
jgi:hypothetical protein